MCFTLRQAHDPRYTAIVYRVRLDRIDPNDVLFGTAYIGQAVRIGSAADVARARWKAEVQQAANEHKQIGFIAVLDAYGEEAFTWEIVDSFCGSRSNAQAWADAREVDEIAKHGGPLRDMDKRIKQTFNQTRGGKGNGWWEGMDAWRSRCWNLFMRELEAYVAEHGTAYVPYAYVNPITKYRLGWQVTCVRRGQLLIGHPQEAARRAWLESLPRWTWNAYKTEEYRQQRSATVKAAHARPEVKAKIKAGNARPEVKARRSAAAKASNARPEVKANIKAAFARPEVKAKHSASAKAAHARPEVKAKHSASIKAALTNPEVKAKHSAGAKAARERENAANPGVWKKRNQEINRRPEVQEKKRIIQDAKRMRTYDEKRATLSDAEFKKWKHKTDINRRACEKKTADVHTIRRVFPEARAADVRKHRRDGTLDTAKLITEIVDGLVARMEETRLPAAE
jgi:hypothetical protein